MAAAAAQARQPHTGADLLPLDYARAYARAGLHIFPCHTALLDHPLGYRCTCEEYRHSDKCLVRHPHLYLKEDEHCANPGKHPRGMPNGLKGATCDGAQIEAWWRKFPDANIGCVPGRSGYVVLDADLYKEHFGGAELLSDEEQATPTTITGGGGRHLWFRKPPGACYSNAPGSLPPGIDVRADTGYVLLPPSQHASGRQYAWLEGRGLRQVAAQELPARIQAVLAAAGLPGHGPHKSVAALLRNTVQPWREPGAPPDLDRWRLPGSIVELIGRPAAKGRRSEADMKVCVALLLAGAADDDVWSVFAHYPIGTAGKVAEAGDGYLARTIDRAHAYIEQQFAGAPPVAVIAELSRWLHRIDLAQFVPQEKQCVTGYRTREVDLAVAAAVLDILGSYGKLAGPISLRQLRRKINAGGLDTVARALHRLAPWFLARVEEGQAPSEDGGVRTGSSTDSSAGDSTGYPAAVKARVYKLNPQLVAQAQESVRRRDTQHSQDQLLGVPSTHATYRAYCGHDAFNATTTPITAEMIAAREAAGKPYSPRYCKTGVFQRRLGALLPAAGRTGIFVIDALVEAGGSLAQAALVGRGGRSRYTVRRAVARLEELELLTVADGTLILAPAWQAQIEEQVVAMPTHGNGGRRIVAEAWRLLASCHVAKEHARRTGTSLPDWVRKREARVWADLERYDIGQDDRRISRRESGSLAAAPNVGVRPTRE